MNREDRFINLVQTTLLLRAQRGVSTNCGWAIRTLTEEDVVGCLDDAYFFAAKNSEPIQRLELDKFAIGYVNNWLNDSPGFRGNSLG